MRNNTYVGLQSFVDENIPRTPSSPGDISYTSLSLGRVPSSRLQDYHRTRSIESLQSQASYPGSVDTSFAGSTFGTFTEVDLSPDIVTQLQDIAGAAVIKSISGRLKSHKSILPQPDSWWSWWRTLPEDFRVHIQLALRFGFAISFVAIPFATHYLMGRHVPDNWLKQGATLMSVLVISSKKSLGATVEAAFYSIMGLVLAACNGFVMCRAIPLYAIPVNYWWEVGLANYTGFAFLLLFFQFPQPVRILALVWSVHFCMAYADPEVECREMMSLSANSDFVSIAVNTFVANMTAILAVCIPWPMSAGNSAKKLAARTALNIAELIVLATRYYCGFKQSVAIHKWLAKLSGMLEKVEGMMHSVEASWWEGSSQEMQSLLARHLNLLQMVLSRLYAIQVCASKETFEKGHKDAMRAVTDDLMLLSVEIGELLMLVTIASVDGHFNDDERGMLNSRIEDCHELAHDLSETWHRNRVSVVEQGVHTAHVKEELFEWEMLNESFFVHEVMALERIVTSYATDMMDLDPPCQPGCLSRLQHHWQRGKDGLTKCWCNLWTVERGTNKVNFLLRNLLALSLCFLVGIFHDFNLLYARNAALMLSGVAGSAVTRNLARLQGTVIGILFGHLLFLQLSHCLIAFAFLRFAVMFVFETVAFYIAVCSEEYSMIGYLLAMFSAQTLSLTCREVDEDAMVSMKAEAYTSIQAAMITCAVYQLIDFVLLAQPASKQAMDQFKSALDLTSHAFTNIVKAKEVALSRPKAKATILDAKRHLLNAIRLGSEAATELRYYKRPWPKELFRCLCDSLEKVMLDLESVQHAIGGPDNNPDDLFGWLASFKAYRKVAKDAQVTLDDACKTAMTVLSHEGQFAADADVDKLMQAKSNVLQLDGAENLIAEMNEKFQPLLATKGIRDWKTFRRKLARANPRILPQGLCDRLEENLALKDRGTIEDDEVTRLKVILVMLDSFVGHVGLMITASIEHVSY